MKKIFNIFAAALMSAAVLTSCAEKEIVTYVPENAVVPALEAINDSYVLEDGGAFATLNFSAAEFGITTAARYTAYADINEDFSSKMSLGNATTDTVGITVSANTLNNALISLNCEAGVPVTVYFRIEAEMMGESSTVETVEALVSNTISSNITPFDAEKVYSSVYVIGAFCGWNHSQTAFLFSYAEDDDNYVGVVDFINPDSLDSDNTPMYYFKITGEANWDDSNLNWGISATESANPTPEPSTLQLVNNNNEGGSQNIVNYSSFRYYNFHFVKSSLTLNMIQGFNSVKVAGDFNGWTTGDANTDEMIQIRSNGKFYIDLDITAAGGFKFILDVDAEQPIWIGTGEGENGVGIGTGDNIQITEPGQYRFYLDLNDWENPTYSLSTADYGKPVGGDDPEPDPEPDPDPDEPVWGIKGDFNGDTGWANEYVMTEFPAGSGIWVSDTIRFAEGNQFKIQYNNYEAEVGAAAAGDTLSTGVVYQGLTSGGSNFGVSASQAGLRKVVLNTNDNTVYILGWGVIGAVAGDSWGNDLPMLYDAAAGTWTSAVPAEIQGEFKLRWAGQWSTSETTVPDRGLADGASFAVGTPINLKQGGGNINPGENVGTYNMVYDVANETLTLTAAE